MSIGYGNYPACGILVILFNIFLDDSESDGRFGSGARLGDDHGSDIPLGNQVHEIGQIFLGKVVPCENDFRIFLSAAQLFREIVRQRLNCAACAKVRASDSYHYHQIHAFCFPLVADSLAILNQRFRSLAWQVFPPEEVITKSVLFVKHIVGRKCLANIFLIIRSVYEGAATFQINSNHFILKL